MFCGTLKSALPEAEKNVLKMALKGSEAHSSGQVNCVLLLVNVNEMINPGLEDMLEEVGLICM